MNFAPAPNLAFPPYAESLVDESGRISRGWAGFFRGLFLSAQLGGLGGWVQGVVNANAYTPDLSAGLTHQITLTGSTPVAINSPLPVAAQATPSQAFRLIVTQDATGAWPTPTFSSGFAGTTGLTISAGAGTYSVFDFALRPDGKFAVVNFIKNLH